MGAPEKQKKQQQKKNHSVPYMDGFTLVDWLNRTAGHGLYSVYGHAQCSDLANLVMSTYVARHQWMQHHKVGFAFLSSVVVSVLRLQFKLS